MDDYNNSVEHYFVYGLFSGAAFSSYHVASHDKMLVDNELERMQNEELNLRYYPEIFLEALRNKAVAQLVEALCYKPEGRRFDPDGVIGIFH